MKSADTHNIIPHITLHHNLLLPLRILTNARTSRELAREHLCSFFQVDAEEVEAVDVGGMFPFGPFRSFDCDLEKRELEIVGSQHPFEGSGDSNVGLRWSRLRSGLKEQDYGRTFAAYNSEKSYQLYDP